MSPISLKIRELRERRGWTQVELSNRANVRQASISELETGKSQRFLRILEKVAAALGVTAASLLDETEPTKQPRKRRRGE
jgi:transcriptional regulator with XRE-family HTH domain